MKKHILFYKVDYLLIVFLLLLVVCCKQAESNDDTVTFTDPVVVTTETLSDSDALIGSWQSSYNEVYIVTTDTFNSGSSSGSMCYAGDSLVVCKISSTYGIMYMKYTRAYDSATEKYTTTSSQVGKWYAVAYWNLTNNSICISGAYKASDGYPCADTLNDAEKKFTFSNGYFSGYSECVKR